MNFKETIKGIGYVQTTLEANELFSTLSLKPMEIKNKRKHRGSLDAK